jgi:hypothetical protein
MEIDDNDLKAEIERIRESATLYVDENTKNSVYPNQYRAFSKILESAMLNKPYISLVAQMQSGKTDTFILTAFEFLRLNIVNHVVIFSGNSDLELKQQLKTKIDEFSFKYQNCLVERFNISHREAQEFYTTNKPKIRIVWGSELKKVKLDEKHHTLFIWEESHHAQNVDMLPAEFIKYAKISPCGEIANPENLANQPQVTQGTQGYLKQRNYFISVSATPFSEIANILLKGQQKEIVYIKPAYGYKGVEYFMKKKLILSHTNEEGDLSKAIKEAEERFPNDKKMYGIVRCQCEDNFIRVANKCGWTVKYFNQEVKDIEIDCSAEPTENTLIFIKGALRMGKEVCKKHIGFVFETSEKQNTDTMLQGLLGRMCSFEPIDHVRIYIHANCKMRGLENYVAFTKSLAENTIPTILPTNAMNMKLQKMEVTTTPSGFSATCPIFVPGIHITVSPTDPFHACISSIFNDIDNFIYSDVVNKNSVQIKEEICGRLTEEHASYHISCRKLSKVSNKKRLAKMWNAVEKGIEYHSTMANENTVYFWIVDEVLPEFRIFNVNVNDVFIEFKTKVPLTLPRETDISYEFGTSGNEVFA